MAKYKYNAYKEKEKTFVSGEIEAATLREAREKILQLGFLPTKVYSEGEENNIYKKKSEDLKGLSINRLSLNEKINFTSELEVLLSSQIPIIEALDMISKNSIRPKVKILAEELGRAIKNGASLKEALENYKDVFNDVYIGLITAGEVSGDIPATFTRLLGLLQKQKAIKDKIVSASIYPAILILLIIGVLGVFCGFIIPRFCAMYSAMGADLPYLTTVVNGFSKFIFSNWLFVLVGLFGCGYGIYTILKSKSFKSFFDEISLKLPFVAGYVKTVNLSNYIAVFAVAYDAGIPISQCASLAATTITNHIVKNQAEITEKCLTNGNSLSDAFRISKILDMSFMSMVTSGEKSGEIGKMLNQIADIFDQRVNMTVDALARAFEPALIIIIGIVVLIILLAFYPIVLGGIPI